MQEIELAEQPQTNGQGRRRWMYPALRKGKFYRYRNLLSYLYLVLFFTGPFLRLNGQPFLLMNVMERRFVLLGQVFWPQDFFLFVLAMLIMVVCIVFFTMAFGRVFCGWICPQTIFMEMVFRKIEIWIEGEAKYRRKLDEGPLTTEKIIKKTSKHTLFVILSFLIANTFLAYIIGSENLLKIMTEPVVEHLAGFISICVFTTIFYLVYSRLRELVCTVICPYGRLQGVLTDNHTLMVAYNYKKGEPRGKLSRKDPGSKGDCVDCGLCVDVCPTGIDIRNGAQLECISCTLCIDACNHVMEKIHRDMNLIGFYSQEMIQENIKPSFTSRMKAYSVIVAVLFGVLAYFIVQRKDVDVTIMRSAGMLYQQQPGNYISNIYNADIINKTDKTQNIRLVAEDPQVKIKYIQEPGRLGKESSTKAVFFLMIPLKGIRSTKTAIKINVVEHNKVLNSINTTFIGPYDED